MAQHIHYDNMVLYAEDAKTNEEPWKLWGVYTSNTEEVTLVPMKEAPIWNLFVHYGRLPKAIRTASLTGADGIKHEFLAPETEAPKFNTPYWYVTFDMYLLSCRSCWTDQGFDKQNLAKGLIHLTQDAAETHAKAFILASGGTMQ